MEKTTQKPENRWKKGKNNPQIVIFSPKNVDFNTRFAFFHLISSTYTLYFNQKAIITSFQECEKQDNDSKNQYDEKAEILRNRLHGVKVHTPVPPGTGDVYVNQERFLCYIQEPLAVYFLLLAEVILSIGTSSTTMESEGAGGTVTCSEF